MSGDARRLAAGVWTARWRVERDAASRFERLARELASIGAVAEVVELAGQAAEDEHRHAALCEELVAHFGEEPPRSALPATAEPRDGVHPEQVLREMVAMSCVTETLSVALLGALVERATDETVARTMRSILRDEVRHSRLGWAHLSSWRERNPAAPDGIGPLLPAMLADTVRDELFSREAEHDLAGELSGLGALPRAVRRETFVQCMREVVFVGLTKLGVDCTAGAAWLDARSPRMR